MGAFWLFISPLFSFLTWFLLNRMQILEPGMTFVPYPVFVLSGTLIWALMMSLISSFLNLYLSYRPFLLNFKVSFPLVVSVIISFNLIKFFVSYSLFLVLVFILGIKLSFFALSFPLLVLPLVLFGSAIGIFVAPFVLITPEFRKIITGMISLSMLFTPIVYMKDSVTSGLLGFAVRCNPLTYLIVTIRDLIFLGQSDFMFKYLVITLLTLLLFLYSLLFLNLTGRRMVEKIL